MKSPRLVDTLVNILIVVTCGVLLAATLPRMMAVTQSTPVDLPDQLRPGHLAESLPSLTYGAAHLTFVLSFRTTCPHCVQSVALYRRLSDAVKSTRHTRFVVVSQKAPDIVADYLRRAGIVAEVITTVGPQRPTPVLVAVSRDGRVANAWVGRLSPEEEPEVFSAVRDAN